MRTSTTSPAAAPARAGRRPRSRRSNRRPKSTGTPRRRWTINSKTMLNVRNGGYRGYFPVEPTPPQTRSGPVSALRSDPRRLHHQRAVLRAVRSHPQRHRGDADALRRQVRGQGARVQVRLSSSSARRSATSRAIPAAATTTTTAASRTWCILWNGYVTNATAEADVALRAGRLDRDRSADAQPGPPPRHQPRIGADRHVLANHALAPRIGARIRLAGRPPERAARALRPLLRRAVRRPVRVHGPEQPASAYHRRSARAK